MRSFNDPDHKEFRRLQMITCFLSGHNGVRGMEGCSEGLVPAVEVQRGPQGHQELLHCHPEVQVWTTLQEGVGAFDGEPVTVEGGRREGKS